MKANIKNIKIMNNIYIWQSRNLYVVVDKTQIFPDDPGKGTPIMVYYTNNNGDIIQSATLNCALGESELSGIEKEDGYILSQLQYNWISRLEELIYKFYI